MDKTIEEQLNTHFETLSDFYNSDGECEVDESGCVLVRDPYFCQTLPLNLECVL